MSPAHVVRNPCAGSTKVRGLAIEQLRSIRASSSEEITDLLFKIIDLGFGPFDLGEATEKRLFRFHDIG